ncbi:MAG: restriction endonuclease subunit S [Candidatus Limiplasma sp.]|nr:restriction endonuclease subunit S [Candidatus Limiplasma sp.]
MSEKRMKPAIRFAGFTEEWERRNASDLFAATADKGHPELPVLSATQDRGMIKREENNINIYHEKDKEEGYKRVAPGQFVIHLRSFQGGFAHSTIEGITSPAYTVFGFKEQERHNDVFWKYIFSSKEFIRRLETVTYGIRDGRSISYDEFLALSFQYPDIGEQERIAAYFKNLDTLITLHQRKYDKLVCVKKAMLEKMFPKNGSCFPEIRFTGFTDAWELRKVGELAEFNPKGELPDTFEYVDLESVVGTEMITHREETRATAPSRAQRLARHGDLFYQTVRPYQKNNCLFEKPDNNYVFSTGYAQMRPNCDGRFLLCLVQTDVFMEYVLDRCTGTSYPAINANDLANMEIPIPNSCGEQKEIGSFFRTLDHLITLEQRALDKLKTLKKAFLEKMFV